MGLGNFDNTEPDEEGTAEADRGRYPDKMKPTPDPDDFDHERESGDHVGPELTKVGGIETLIDRIESCETTREWSFLLNDYIKWGNNTEVASNVAIFSMNSAHDCVNRWTERCQVEGNECYAVEDEKMYDYVLDYTRRQEYLWDCMPADLWADAFISILSRKRSKADTLRFSQNGDFRVNGDIVKVNRIAERLSEHGVEVYAYTASSHLDWSLAESDNLTISQSNDDGDYGVRRFMVVESPEDIPSHATWCPRDYQKHQGSDSPVKCGECRLCITDDVGDIAVTKK